MVASDREQPALWTSGPETGQPAGENHGWWVVWEAARCCEVGPGQRVKQQDRN